MRFNNFNVKHKITYTKPKPDILTAKQFRNNTTMAFKFGLTYLAITLNGLVFASLLNFSMAIFNAEELKSINYEIDILSVPVKEGQFQDLPVMQIMSKFGQQYQCQLPVLVSDQDPNDGSRIPEPEVPDVNELLSPLLNAPCLLKTKDWWTYEFCFGRFIRQYHIEESQMSGPILNLGIFDQSLNSNKNLNSEGNSQLQQNRYFSQYYVNGSKCDLTGTLRSSEVRFFCESDVSDYIARVDEPETCRYIVTIHTAKVCSHPHLKPLPSVKPHMILCNPVLAHESFEKYQQRVQEEKERAEKKRQEWIAVQQQKLEELKQQKIQELKTKIQEYNDKRDNGDETKDGDTDESVNLVNEDLNDDDELESINELELMSNEMLEKLLKEKSKVDELETASSDISDKLVKEEAKLQETVSSQLETIKKARELLQNINQKKKEVTVQEMVSTLFSLIDNMAQAETEMNTATDRLEKIKMANKALKKKFKDGENERLEKLESAKVLIENGKRQVDSSKKVSQSDSLIEEDEKEEEYDSESLATPTELTTGEKITSTPQEEEKVQVRIRRINTGASKSDNKVQWFRQKDLDVNQKQKLEDAVKEKLEEAGLSTNGRHIEVKIITAGYYDDEEGKDFHVFSDEETRQFQSMIISLLARNREAKREMDRQRKMEQNYHFKWNEDVLPNLDINEELNL